MRILLVGSGGREHALAWKLKQSPLVETLLIAPGNPGTAQEGHNLAITDDDIPALVRAAKEHAVDMVVPGPELPLVLGLKDALANEGIACFGPNAFCARLEGSKVFAKNMMRRAGIPTANFRVFEEAYEARQYAKSHPLPMVVKADGLAAGKGVIIAKTVDEALEAIDRIMVQRIFDAAGERIIIEEALIGEEASLLAFCDGKTVVPLSSAQDHKPVGENDTGPNTGGMGAYTPAPILPEQKLADLTELTITPLIRLLAEKGHPFQGVIYAGLMFTADGPFVLEYNVRFGDPECQPLMVRLESDLAEIMSACCRKELHRTPVRWSPQTGLCVVLSAPGYPGSYPKGMPITGLEQADEVPGVKVFQAGTAQKDDRLVTSGGRVLGVTALAPDLRAARDAAYQAADQIQFDGKYLRRDIGAKGMARA
ncbi:phosphoribosylamine--glycine ligase [Desulfonatronum thiosulfatophilum]|uniref:Phosphoribosylamine--glycine ligase n=1 Tax=Desulfonatronum thiosulfatophilum TaxID=617002 RepID=A0A1G6EQW5_9BACT|nr:phosphoribosylamine--glycine ligase [Desulfonatronum thiosulfatophilum]SDB59780.1 phosphoribosylamine--glycine ligase [Desulfonatronum thiosulfatophilum]